MLRQVVLACLLAVTPIAADPCDLLDMREAGMTCETVQAGMANGSTQGMRWQLALPIVTPSYVGDGEWFFKTGLLGLECSRTVSVQFQGVLRRGGPNINVHHGTVLYAVPDCATALTVSIDGMFYARDERTLYLLLSTVNGEAVGPMHVVAVRWDGLAQVAAP